MNDIVGGFQRRQLEEQLENQLAGMRVPNHIPADHKLIRLFLESLNRNMIASELNDDDVAALQEQMNELLEAGVLPQQQQEGEEEWQQDWNSDDEQ